MQIMSNVEQEAVKQVIVRAYIGGIHGNADEAQVKSGFHEDFAMLSLQDGGIVKVTVDAWLDRPKILSRAPVSG